MTNFAPAGPRAGLAALFAATALLGCQDHPLKPVKYKATTEPTGTIPLAHNRKVDILFVIDNSNSMGEEQATLAANFEKFIAILEREDVKADYRIGITTTDVGNAACDSTGREDGRLVLSSCGSRTEQFRIGGGSTVIDVLDEACPTMCREQWAHIETLPTEIDDGGPAQPRPWIEHKPGTSNLPEGLSTATAFACLAPQGISGCGFEAPLEASQRALLRATTATEKSFGFTRDDAVLAIIFVTDEADCSANKDFDEEVFGRSGNRVFWSDPEATAATSAVCWNAGVECTDAQDGLDCQVANYSADGKLLSQDDDAAKTAVLHPVSRYIDFLDRIAETKQGTAACGEDHGRATNRQVLVGVIAGVDSSGTAHFSPGQDGEFIDNYGIGAGCSSANGTAVPPVRLADFAAHYAETGEQNMFSICSTDYTDALEAIAHGIVDEIGPACVPACVADQDPSTPELEMDCVVIQESCASGGSNTSTAVVPCAADGTLPKDDVDLCYIAKSDGAKNAKGTPTLHTDRPLDDMSPECVEAGWNLEFELVFRPGHEPGPDTAFTAKCSGSAFPSEDCPWATGT